MNKIYIINDLDYGILGAYTTLEKAQIAALKVYINYIENIAEKNNSKETVKIIKNDITKLFKSNYIENVDGEDTINICILDVNPDN